MSILFIKLLMICRMRPLKDCRKSRARFESSLEEPEKEDLNRKNSREELSRESTILDDNYSCKMK